MAPGKLGELLLSQGVVSQEQLNAALDHRTKMKGRLASSLVALGHVNERVLATFLSKHYGITAVSLDDVQVDAQVASLIPLSLCERHCIAPLGLENNKLLIAISDPTNVAAIDDIRFLCNLDVVVYIATESAIRSLLERTYSNAFAQIAGAEKLMDSAEESSQTGTNIEIIKESVESHQVESEVSEKPVIRLINKIILEAIRRRASDIHLEPFESFSRVRYRIDGTLYEVMKVPLQLKAALSARVKVMANMDISEKRLPQDGRIQVNTKLKRIDVRVSTLPTIFGEKVVMRILDQSAGKAPTLTSCGFEEEQLKIFCQAALQPYGMVLVTGPTGSGKTTTLYAVLSELNQADVNICTVEDPVEYNILGVSQVQMKESIGLTFASALRSFLRQDPDIILVGEIRDQETAEIAIKASLTGHMVFSTVHTNDAPSTISRLLHMGVEPFLITASLTLVQAQRLVRLICKHCRQVDEKITSEMLTSAEVPESWLESIKPMRGTGCNHCGGTGYRGRQGIYEVMPLSEKLRELVIKGGNSDTLKQAAIEEGLLTLRQAALLKFYRGETTFEEVLNNSRPDKDLVKT